MNKISTISVRFLMVSVVAALLLSGCASQYIKSGEKAFNDLRYRDAIWSLEKGLAKKDDQSARRMLARSYLMIDDYKKANEQFALTSVYTDNTDNDRIMQGQTKMANGQYAEAREIFEGIVSRDPSNKIAQSMLNSCKKLQEMKRDSLTFIVEPVNIPSEFAVYSAYPFKDGLIVSSPATKGDKDPYTNNAFTDLYFTKKEGSNWSTPTLIPNVNSKYHDAVAAVSPNGQTMVFTRSFQLNKALAGDANSKSNTQLYYCKMGADGNWSMAELLPFCDTKYMFAHPAYSTDGKTLYFASDRPGGLGKMDIYETTISEGAWGNPVNLGSDVNTSGDELFPTTRGNEKLYYSSDGQNTLGGLDINYTEKVNGKWGMAKHVSYPINTASDDFSMVWNQDGTTGYFTSDRTSSDRIYSFSEINAKVSLSGLITGKDSMLPLGGVRVTIMNLTDGTEKTVFTDGDGKFTADLEPGKDYKIKSELEGYFATTEDISTKGITGDKIIQRVVELPELYVTPKDGTANNGGNNGGSNNGNDGGNNEGNNNGNGTTKGGKGVYDVPNIYWDYNKWDIRPDAEPYLDYVVKLFRDNPKLKFEIASHCDCRGSFEYNDDLSSKRAKAVVDYLVKKGVSRSLLTSKGYGERKLVNECSDGVFCPESKHQENRRTEFTVIDKKK